LGHFLINFGPILIKNADVGKNYADFANNFYIFRNILRAIFMPNFRSLYLSSLSEGNQFRLASIKKPIQNRVKKYSSSRNAHQTYLSPNWIFYPAKNLRNYVS